MRRREIALRAYNIGENDFKKKEFRKRKKGFLEVVLGRARLLTSPRKASQLTKW